MAAGTLLLPSTCWASRSKSRKGSVRISMVVQLLTVRSDARSNNSVIGQERKVDKSRLNPDFSPRVRPGQRASGSAVTAPGAGRGAADHPARQQPAEAGQRLVAGPGHADRHAPAEVPDRAVDQGVHREPHEVRD